MSSELHPQLHPDFWWFGLVWVWGLLLMLLLLLFGYCYCCWKSVQKGTLVWSCACDSPASALNSGIKDVLTPHSALDVRHFELNLEEWGRRENGTQDFMGWPLRCDHKHWDLCGLEFWHDVLDTEERDSHMLTMIAAEGKCVLGHGGIFTDKDSKLG